MVLKLEKIGQITIVDGKGKPSSFFQTLWQRTIEAIQGSINNLAELVALIQQVQAQQAIQLDLITAAQNTANAAQATANNAQTSADSGGTPTAVSGSASSPNIDVSSNVTWSAGPVVSLAGVVAGTLTIPGSGPSSDSNTTLTIVNTNITLFLGEFRIVEVIAGIDGTIFGPYTYTAVVQGPDPTSPGSYPATVFNDSSSDVAAVSSARASTGAVDYRIDFRRSSGPALANMAAYVFARRA